MMFKCSNKIKRGGNMLIKKIQQQLIHTINEKLQTDFLIIVGLFAKGTEHQNSDIDIVYASNQSLLYNEYTMLIRDLVKIAGREVDLIDFKKVDSDFAAHVLNDGLPIYIKSNNEFIQFKKRNDHSHN